MGKGRSPGKWIKNLFSGKKSSSKSSSSKNNDIFKSLSNKDTLGISELTVSNPIPTVDSLLISPPISGANVAKGLFSEKEVVTRSSHERDIVSNGGEEAQGSPVANFAAQVDLETLTLTDAAIKLQAACRGYRARWEFQTQKAITQLQALIRGHLVRRQAVSALYCVKRIVKVQALARGYNVRRSDIGLEVLKIRKDTQCSKSIGSVTSTEAEKLPDNVFVHKLLASSSHAFPLSIRSDFGEPYLAENWLDRWTRSHFWAPLPKLKKKHDLASVEKNISSQTVEKGQVKRNTRKSPTVKANDGSTSGSNKQKQGLKKDSNHSLVSAQEHEHPRKEIEKGSIKKTRMQNVSDRSEIVSEKRKHSIRTISDHTVTDVSDHTEKMKVITVPKSEESYPEKAVEENNGKPTKSLNGGVKEEKGLGQKAVEENNDKPKKSLNSSAIEQKGLGQKALEDNNEKPKKSLNGGAKEQKALEEKGHNDPTAVLQTSVKNVGDVKIGVSEDLNGGDKIISNNCQRRASLPANFNDQENELHNTPRLPSYMAPTESAKARLRGQGSPRFATDFLDKNSLTRRHSLSSSFNSKSGSFSPRAEKLVSLSSRGVARTDKSLSSSRDGTDKLTQPQWRR
ncbi:protein IQ-DOMAIN 29 [Lathyrus oleraceus]|uniref:DUF4005 domain-containing protein n=1 Tax=Pisum sativum TaxID=3888 RepID=A0A9D4YFF4_PEA|nr:protein IQ-DOMAIN 29-like [Pisum sativum]KAI5437569.1 hypothetical protein KIW84_023618 [Pisum sativum]